jgi:hypothetical protein
MYGLSTVPWYWADTLPRGTPTIGSVEVVRKIAIAAAAILLAIGSGSSVVSLK